MATLASTIHPRAGWTVLALQGDLTAAAVAQVQTDIAQLPRPPGPRLIIDLARVPTCDAAGAFALLAIAVVAGEQGGEVRLAAASGATCRMLRAAGVMQTVPTFGSVAGALADNPVDLLATPAP